VPTPNPILTLQQRIVDLLEANAYFTGLSARQQLLTERIADLEYQVENVLLPLGFGVVVTTASGKSTEDNYEALQTDEDLNVSITHNPTTDLTHNALDAVWAAMQAIHGKTVKATPPSVLTERDYFRVTGHQRRLDGPAGCHVHEIYVLAGLRLL
jgi:hypothetical protein